MTIASSSYRAVAAAIRDAITEGRYPRGTELPSQEDLAAAYGVDQSTISKAIRVLTAEGKLANPGRGKRAIVTALAQPIRRNPSIRYSRAARERHGAVGAYDAEIRALGMEPRVDLSINRVQPPARAAELLGVDAEGPSAIVRARVMWADQTLTQLADSYVSAELFGGTVLEQVDEGQGGMISRMAELGHAQVRITESVTGRPPTPAEAKGLGISVEQHIYVIEHVGWTADDRAVEVTIHKMPQHLWVLETEFSID